MAATIAKAEGRGPTYRATAPGLPQPERRTRLLRDHARRWSSRCGLTGRALRRKPDARAARLVVLDIAGTAEDPVTGAHAAFLDELLRHAVGASATAPGLPRSLSSPRAPMGLAALPL
jgi:hypothetical protein